MIPFYDMRSVNIPEKDEYLKVIGEVIDSGELAGGRFVEHFENEFSTYCGTNHAVGVGSGTDALWLALLAIGVGPGDEVVTVPMSFVATVEAICRTGAKPVFVDIDERTYTMDPEALERVLTPATKAVLPVHLFGQTAEMEAIMEIASKRGLRVIEDAAQAHGAEYQGRKAGSIGDAGCFSFYPAKNLGALGEAGAVVTNDKDLARRLRALRNHGQSTKNQHRQMGWNSRMDGIQAAVLEIKLRALDTNNRQRAAHARFYDKNLNGLPGLVSPQIGANRQHVYHIYAVRVSERESFCRRLEQLGIGFGVHYPVPIHLQAAYRMLGHQAGGFPVAEQCADEFVSLPMFPEMTIDQISAIISAVKASVAPRSTV